MKLKDKDLLNPVKKERSIQASNESTSTQIGVQRSIQGSHLIPLSALLYYPNVQTHCFSALKDKSVNVLKQHTRYPVCWY